MITNRPWGFFNLLHKDSECWFKKVVVKPGQRLSLQKHKYRDEVWTIVSGFARITIRDDEFTAGQGSVLRIPAGSVHRIENLGSKTDLVFLETVTGKVIDEADIERLQDSYGRVSDNNL